MCGKEGEFNQKECEDLVDTLDETGANSFRRGDYRRALKAFTQALQIRTHARVEFDPRSVAKNIHCIGDVYSKQSDWKKALDAYGASIDALQSCSKKDEDTTRATIRSLERKVFLAKTRLGNNKSNGLLRAYG